MNAEKKGRSSFSPGVIQPGFGSRLSRVPGQFAGVPLLRACPAPAARGGRRCVDAAKLLGRVFAIDVPDVFQKRDDVRFLFQGGWRRLGCSMMEQGGWSLYS